MKRSLFALVVALLSVIAVGCRKGPDDLLKSKVPDSADFILLVDGSMVTQTAIFQEFLKEPAKDGLKELSLSEDVLNCRVLVFGSPKDEWGGILVQSQKGEAKTVYDLLVAKLKERDKESKLKVAGDGKSFTCSAGEGEPDFLGELCSDDLMLFAVGKKDLDFFQGKDNELFEEIQMKDTILSAAGKFRLPTEFMGQKVSDEAIQAVPALQQLDTFSLNIPFAKDDQKIDFRLTFKDDKSASEALGALEAFLSSTVAKEAPKVEKEIVRSVEKNVLTVSLKSIKPIVDEAKASTKRAAAQAQSTNNLKQIGLALLMYDSDNNRLPSSLSELSEKGYLDNPKCYISPLDGKVILSTGKVIRQGNTSYAYVGKGISTSSASASLPIAFEKPSAIGENGFCAYLRLDGSVSREPVRGKTCRAIAEELLEFVYGVDEKDKALILANAEAIDKGK